MMPERAEGTTMMRPPPMLPLSSSVRKRTFHEGGDVTQPFLCRTFLDSMDAPILFPWEMMLGSGIPLPKITTSPAGVQAGLPCAIV